jgi:hypothetical protein
MCMACAPLSKTNAPDLDTAVPVTAIWRTQNLNFDYHGTSARYSCSGLRAKISSILRAVGAHESLRVELQCNAGLIARGARAQIVVTTPIEATEENVRAATTYDSRDHLVARLRSVHPPTAGDIQRFPATWRRIALSSDRRVRLDAGDCDLIRGMREQIFSKLSIQMTRASFNCSSGSAPHVRPTLEVTALVPLDSS